MGLFDSIFAGGGTPRIAVPNMVGHTGCVPRSLYDAIRWNKDYGDNVSIAISKIDRDKDIDHAQAIAVINGKYTPLTSHEHDGVVRPWVSHFPEVTPHRHVSVDQFMEEQSGNLDPEVLQYLKKIRE